MPPDRSLRGREFESYCFHSIYFGISCFLTSHQLISFILIYFLYGVLNSFIDCYKSDYKESLETNVYPNI